MSVSRRIFVKGLSVGGIGALSAPFITARGSEALAGELASAARRRSGTGGLELASDAALRLRIGAPHGLRLDSNENPNGPAKSALDAISAMLGEANRYPMAPAEDLRTAIAKHHGVKPENILLGCGSGDVLRMAALAFTSPARALVTAAPTFEDPGRYAESIGAKVRAVRVDRAFALDLDGMARACTAGERAGLMFLCNPNNPTGTVHGQRAIRDLVDRVRRESPETTVLLDEAYFEYVEDPSYATGISLAMDNARVIVSRTFSKVHGMAGLRVGYAVGQAKTLDAMSTHRLSNGVNVLGAAAALASLGDDEHIARERTLNREAREFTRGFFESLGYHVVPSNTNFILVDIRRPAKDFQDACAKQDVLVGRPFPPLDRHARVSIGTVAEMRRATEVFRRVLASV